MFMRRLGQVVGSWLFISVYGVAASLLTILTLGLFSRRLAPFILRVWGRIMLRLAGITFEVQGEEHLRKDAMKIVPFNHGSLLDAFLVPALMPPGSVAALKREALYYPVVGITVYLLGFLLIDRSRSAKAHRIMSKAAARMAKDRLTVFIAPEGTRSMSGELLPFKKGALHIALSSHAPIVPMLIDGAFELHPPGRVTTTPGHIIIRFLPPRPTTGLTAENIAEETEALRALYVTELARLRADRLAQGDKYAALPAG